MKKVKSNSTKKRSLFHWHRQIGLAVSLLVIILSVTGVLLNHTEEFELDSNYVQSDYLLKWYGINKPMIKSYAIGDNWLSQVNDKVYFNKSIIQKEIFNLTGAANTKNFIAFTTNDTLILLTKDGELIEKLNATTGIPQNISSLGLNSNDQLFIKTKTDIFKANEDITEWEKSDTKNVTWSKMETLPKDLEGYLNASFRGEGLSKERVVLDIHSGRIIGKAGPYIMDLAAVLLLVLSFTGIWMYVKRSWAMRKRNLLLNAATKGDTYSAADLRRGEEGIILTVIGDEAFRQRLAAMGVMAGTVIATPATSIFGDPRTYLVRGYQLSMRTTEAALILLQTDEQLKHHVQDEKED